MSEDNNNIMTTLLYVHIDRFNVLRFTDTFINSFLLNLCAFFFFLMIRPPPRSPLFPSTPLFRSTAPTRPALHVVLPVSPAAAGAYLYVLRGTARDYPRLQRRYYFPDGLVCGRGYDVHPDRGCNRPPGFPPAPARPPVRLPPPLHVPIHALRGYAVRFVSPYVNRRY